MQSIWDNLELVLSDKKFLSNDCQVYDAIQSPWLYRNVFGVDVTDISTLQPCINWPNEPTKKKKILFSNWRD